MRNCASGEVSLARSYENALDLADDRGIASIAFPAISTGAFGYPMEAAARIAVRVLVDRARGLTWVAHIRMVLFDDGALEAHARLLEDGEHIR